MSPTAQRPTTMRRALRRKSPSLQFEAELWADGAEVVVGVDEVGRGAWAGPLTVGAVVAPTDRRIYKVRDSKMLSPAEREATYVRIDEWARAWSVGHAWPAECDELGMSAAQKLATARALEGLGLSLDHVLVDGNWDFVETVPTTTIVKGDAKCLSIAAASIMAKVTRDRMMIDEADHYNSYCFESNKGYPCPRHRAALQWVGSSPIHRRSWAFMDEIHWSAERRVTPAAWRVEA